MNFITTGFRSYKEEKEMSNEKTNYGKTIREFYNEAHEELNEEKSYSIKELMDIVSKKVYSGSGKNIKPGTNRAHITWFTINEKNRCHHNTKSPVDDTINLFYYTDSSKKLLRKLDFNNPPEAAKIYWRDDSTNEIQEGLISDFYPKL
jgi:hypothetical protein